jgi:fructose-specific PTS system IIA-like component
MTGKVSTLLEVTFVCSLSSGLHARPASQLAEMANEFASDCTITNTRNQSTANLKSVLAIISADIRNGDRCILRIGGPDQQSAREVLSQFVERVLPRCDIPAPGVMSPQAQRLPRVLQSNHVVAQFGVSVSHGIAHGKVVLLDGLYLPTNFNLQSRVDPHEELQKIQTALTAVRDRIREKLAVQVSPAEAGILGAHLAIVNDVSLAREMERHIEDGRCAGQAVIETGKFFMSVLRHSETELIRERAIDIEEICLQLLDEIYGADLQSRRIDLTEPSILVAETIAPQQLLSAERRHLKGLVLEYSGTTSHAVILAKSLGIPTVVGVKGARRVLIMGEEIFLDANRGFAVPHFSTPVRRFYESERITLQQRKQSLSSRSMAAAFTTDGKTIEVAANVTSSREAAEAFQNGADGIGLFRSEILFLERNQPLSEDEQFEIYAEAVRAGGGKPVIIRTFDVGGDKPAPYFRLPREDNPFLGYRGVRIYSEHQELLQTQLKAILRASAVGRVRIMAPMISSLTEALQFKAAVSEAKRVLSRSGVAFSAEIPVGIMIEVPSAALIIDQLSTVVDFFSIGTNDLSQYFFAADRGNAKVASLYNVRHPAFIRFLARIVEQSRFSGKWVGMCGEMANEILNLPLLVGLGLDEVSLSGPLIPELKRKIAQLSAADCHEVVARAMSCRDTAEVKDLLQTGVCLGTTQPLLSQELVLLQSECKTKEEVIQEIVNTLYIAGRTENRDQLEDALWAREAVYSTGLGFGFATPHCKTPAVTASSIAILKLRQPVEWNSVDGDPVRVVVLIATRDSDTSGAHLQVFSRLARKLMNEDFRQYLLAAGSAGQITEYLAQQLESHAPAGGL